MFKHNIVVVAIFATLIGLGSSYHYVYTELTFTEAYANCKSLGMELVEISNATEFVAVTTYLTDINSTSLIWISGTDAFYEGTWIGMTSGLPLHFLNWASDQPDNYGGNENCMQMRSGVYSYEYNDGDCMMVLPSVCK